MTARQVLVELEAAGVRFDIEGNGIRAELPTGFDDVRLGLLRSCRAEVLALLHERRVEAVVASRRRCSEASRGLEGEDTTRGAGRSWCAAADAYGRGETASDAAMLAAEAAVIAAWDVLRQRRRRVPCFECRTVDAAIFIAIDGVGLVCGRCWRGEGAP